MNTLWKPPQIGIRNNERIIEQQKYPELTVRLEQQITQTDAFSSDEQQDNVEQLKQNKENIGGGNSAKILFGSKRQQNKQQRSNVINSNNNNNNNKNNDTISNQKRNDKKFTHSWLLTSLKGHTDEVYDVCYSANGKYLVTCSEDRTLFVWTAGNAIIGDTQNRKSLRVNVEYDHATKVCWSPDSRAIIIHKSTANCIEVYKVDKKDGFLGNPVKGLTFSKPSNLNQETDIIGMGISCTGRFIMTCSNSTDIIIWTLKGHILHVIDTCLMNNYSAKISSCGRFIGACGFSPDAKVWEVKFTGAGEYVKTVNAFNLTGHTSGIYDIAFDQDTSHMATVSKDGTWKLFNTKVEYEQGQLPRCLLTGKYTQSSVPSKIALSINGEVIAIASGMHIEIFSGLTGNCDEMITKIYNGYINAITFDPFGKYIVTAGDKCIYVFHNVTGYRVSTVVAKEKLKQKNQTSATRERLTKLIEDNELFLKGF